MSIHLNEDQLVLHYYGETAQDAAQHLAECGNCRDAYQTLQRVLNSVDALPVPERHANYEAHVWSRLLPLLHRPRPWYRQWPSWKPIAIAALLFVAFHAGRQTYQPAKAPATLADTSQIRERVLLVALGAHLERTKMMLVELSNAQPQAGHFDISLEQEAASRLLAANRLYRQTATSTGNLQISAFLEELERLLLELAHSPASMPESQWEELRQRMESGSLLFKVKVFSSQLEAPANRL